MSPLPKATETKIKYIASIGFPIISAMIDAKKLPHIANNKSISII